MPSRCFLQAPRSLCSLQRRFVGRTGFHRVRWGVVVVTHVFGVQVSGGFKLRVDSQGFNPWLARWSFKRAKKSVSTLEVCADAAKVSSAEHVKKTSVAVARVNVSFLLFVFIVLPGES